MKRNVCLLLTVLLMLCTLTSCTLLPWDRSAEQIQTVTFYYPAAGADTYGAGALYPEQRSLPAKELTADSLLRRYWTGPHSSRATQLLPSQLELLSWQLDDGLLTLEVSDHWLDLSQLEARLAGAGLVMTMSQLPDVDRLCIRTGQDVADGASGMIFDPGDYLLSDESANSDQIAVKLCFSDTAGRFLVQENRTHAPDTAAELAAFIVRELLAGPQDKNSLAILPEGTNLLRVELSQGVCTVDLSEAFLTNAPDTQLQARLAVFSVVNSLTQLSEVESVKLLCVGRAITDYAGLDLSQPLVREELAIRPDSGSASDLDVTMYLPYGDRLAAVPVSVRQSVGKSGADAVLSTLLSFEPANGYDNPIGDGTALVAYRIQDGLCTVTFNNAFIQQNTDADRLTLAVRSVTATLCSMAQIDRVCIQVSDANLTTGILGQELTPDDSWFWP